MSYQATLKCRVSWVRIPVVLGVVSPLYKNLIETAHTSIIPISDPLSQLGSWVPTGIVW